MRWLAGAVAAALLISPLPAQAGTPGEFTAYPLPAGSGPSEAATGSDGAVWITLATSNRIGRMTLTGDVTTFPVTTPAAGLDQLALGSDGNIWFTEGNASRIGRITTAGVVTEFPTPTPNARPRAITAGPGGMWFTEAGPAPQRVARIAADGTIAEFPVPGGIATDVTAGPDGNIWYTGDTDNIVGRMDIAGAATEFFAPGTPTGIVTADAGSLWYTQGTGGAISRMTTAGTRQSGTPLPTSSAGNTIIRGNDGNSWFTENAAGRVGFITDGGQVSDFALGVTQIGGLAAGADGAMWVPHRAGNQMFRVDTAVSSAAPPPPPVLGRSMGATVVSGTVLVKLPGAKGFVKLLAGQALPVGTIVDTLKGRLRLTATSGAASYAADFFQGRFQIAQKAKKGATADLKLFGGSFRRCPRGLRAAARKKSIRHLWGNGSGKFKTIGRFSSAAIRGTTWLTDDQCTGTLTRVTKGSVTVRDFKRRRNIVVKAPRRYFARG